MARIAFGRQQYDAKHSVFDAVAQALLELPGRHRACFAEIVMRGSSSEYEEWIVLEVSRTPDTGVQACIDWVAQQVTRKGFVIVPMDRL